MIPITAKAPFQNLFSSEYGGESGSASMVQSQLTGKMPVEEGEQWPERDAKWRKWSVREGIVYNYIYMRQWGWSYPARNPVVFLVELSVSLCFSKFVTWDVRCQKTQKPSLHLDRSASREKSGFWTFFRWGFALNNLWPLFGSAEYIERRYTRFLVGAVYGTR